MKDMLNDSRPVLREYYTIAFVDSVPMLSLTLPVKEITIYLRGLRPFPTLHTSKLSFHIGCNAKRAKVNVKFVTIKSHSYQLSHGPYPAKVKSLLLIFFPAPDPTLSSKPQTSNLVKRGQLSWYRLLRALRMMVTIFGMCYVVDSR